LPNNLILDFEKSTKRVECYKVDIDSVKKYYEVINELKTDKQFEYITIDTITSMEQIAKDLAEFKYSKTAFGTNWYSDNKAKYLDILNLPMGAGHMFLKDAYIDLIKAALSTKKRVIIIGHVKENFREENGISIQFNDIDLHNATKRALFAKYIEAYGYIYRREENVNMITFVQNTDINVGSRGRLGAYKKEFSKKNENGELVVDFSFLEY